MHAHNAAMHLERSLPLVLQQDYPTFEVLVVVDNCTDLTVERLQLMEQSWPSLRHLILPSSSWHPDRHRLAMALGAKSASYDWIMALQPDFAPHSTHWLRLMAEALGNDTESVISFCGFEDNDEDSSKAKFYSVFEQQLCLPFYRPSCDDSNVLTRRDLVLHDSPIIIQPLLHPQASVHRVIPYGDLWWKQYKNALRRSLASRGWELRTLHFLSVWSHPVILVLCIALSLLTWWWAGIIPYALHIIVTAFSLNSFARRVGEKKFYFTYWWQTLTMPLEQWK